MDPADRLRPSPGAGERSGDDCAAVRGAVQLPVRSARHESASKRSVPRYTAALRPPRQKPGVTSGSGAPYSTWWNGGLRTTADLPQPDWHPDRGHRQPDPDVDALRRPFRLRRAIDYSVTANRAVLDAASRQRETWLLNIYQMGKNSIERGSRDWWTASPHRPGGTAARSAAARPAWIHPARRPARLSYRNEIRQRAHPRTGITVHRATDVFKVAGRAYPAGSYVVKTAQAFRPHVLDMFEPQDHPDDVSDERAQQRLAVRQRRLDARVPDGGRFDRVLEGFDGPFERDRRSRQSAARARLPARAAQSGISSVISQNDAVIAVNRLLKSGDSVFWLQDRSSRRRFRADGRDLRSRDATSQRDCWNAATRELGLTVTGVATLPRTHRASAEARACCARRSIRRVEHGWLDSLAAGAIRVSL